MVTITLEQFLWALRAPTWQRDDYREHCIDSGTADRRVTRDEWVRDFEDFVAADSELFDADGGGTFIATDGD